MNDQRTASEWALTRRLEAIGAALTPRLAGPSPEDRRQCEALQKQECLAVPWRGSSPRYCSSGGDPICYVAECDVACRRGSLVLFVVY